MSSVMSSVVGVGAGCYSQQIDSHDDCRYFSRIIPHKTVPWCPRFRIETIKSICTNLMINLWQIQIPCCVIEMTDGRKERWAARRAWGRGDALLTALWSFLFSPSFFPPCLFLSFLLMLFFFLQGFSLLYMVTLLIHNILQTFKKLFVSFLKCF